MTISELIEALHQFDPSSIVVINSLGASYAGAESVTKVERISELDQRLQDSGATLFVAIE